MSECDAAPVCTKCKITSSVLWQRNKEGDVICLDCHTRERTVQPLTGESPTQKQESSQKHTVEASSSKPSQQQTTISSQPDPSSIGMVTRRTTRSHERAKARQQLLQAQQEASNTPPPPLPPLPPPPNATPPIPNHDTTSTMTTNTDNTRSKVDVPKVGDSITTTLTSNDDDITTSKSDIPEEHKIETLSLVSMGTSASYSNSKNRRDLIQGRPPMQAPQSQPYMVTTNSIQHNGTVFEIGDVVSLLDRDGGVYYAITQGFLLDQYADKYAVLTWLLPKYPNPTHFDPAAFILGPEEDVPRTMDCIEFVCHSPQSRHFQSSYFQDLEQAQMWFTSAQ